jgi:hypothetical protein
MKLAHLLTCGAVVLAAIAFFAPTAGAYQTPVFPGIELKLEGATGILDVLYGWGNVARIDDGPLPGDQTFPWLTGGSAYAQARYAGANNTFGYFVGPSGGAFNPLFTVAGGLGFLAGSPSAAIPLAPTIRFGLNSTTGFTWSSLETENVDQLDHMVSYAITGGAAAGDFVVCFEDRPAWISDKDYNDMVVQIHAVNPVPEPATMTLMGLGLISSGLLGGLRRKKR